MSDKLYIRYTVARHTNENNMKLYGYHMYLTLSYIVNKNIKAYLVTYTK